jgi:hypothetical protein
MPDIPALNTFTAGAVANYDDYNENFFHPVGAAPDSLEVVNGWLSTANITAANTIKTRMIQRGEMSKGKQVGKTASLDYIWEMFPNTDGDAGEWKPVPGLGMRFYLRFVPSITIFTWSVMEANTRPEESLVTEEMAWQLRVDDNVYAATHRKLCSGVQSDGTGFLEENVRCYSGHHTLRVAFPAPGWHSASLRLNIRSAGYDHVKVHARSFRVLWFK